MPSVRWISLKFWRSWERAVLGLIVGVVVVAQTIYAATIDHIREYGTLKAMGATNGYIYRVILKQAVTSAVIGYAVGITFAIAAEIASRSGGAAILLPIPVRIGLFGLTLAMCISAAMVSINKVTKIDPAMVLVEGHLRQSISSMRRPS